MPTIRVNDTGIFYELIAGTGDCLVLVHGSWVDHTTWDWVVQPLAQSFGVLTYDRRGHTLSERSDVQGNIQEDVADLAGLIEQLRLGPAHIVGSSYGAIVVLRLAMARPDLFRSMVLHEPPLLGLLMTSEEGRQLHAQVVTGVSSIVEQLARGDLEAGARRFIDEVAIGPGAWDQLPPEAQQALVFNAPTFLDEIQDSESFNVDLERIAGVSIPTLLTRGDASYPYFLGITDTLASALPLVEEHIFAGAGHVPHISHPDEFIKIVTSFVRKHSPA